MILASYKVPLPFVSQTMLQSYLSLALSGERNEYGIFPTEEQQEGFSVGRNYVNNPKGMLAHLNSPGVMSNIMQKFENIDYSRDFDATKIHPLTNMCYNDAFTHLNYMDADDRHAVQDIPDDELLDVDTAAKRANLKECTIRLEDIDPTWVYKYISTYMITLKKPNEGNRVTSFHAVDTKDIYSDDGDQVMWYTIREEEDIDDVIDQARMIKELAYNCRYLYEVGKRTNIGIHMLAACACIKHFKDSGTKMLPFNLCINYLLWFKDNTWVAKCYCGQTVYDEHPGIQLVHDYINKCLGANTAFTPNIIHAIETVIHITSLLNIDMHEDDSSVWLSIASSSSKVKLGLAQYYYENFNDEKMPRLMREAILNNDVCRSDMFYMLKNLYKTSVNMSEVKPKTGVFRCFDIADDFHRRLPMLSCGKPSIPLMDFACTDTEALEIVCKQWTLFMTLKIPSFTNYVTFRTSKEMAVNFDFSDGVLSLINSPTALPIPITFTIGDTNYFMTSGGFLLPFCKAANNYPIAIDYLEDTCIFTAKGVLKAATTYGSNFMQNASLIMYSGGV